MFCGLREGPSTGVKHLGAVSSSLGISCLLSCFETDHRSFSLREFLKKTSLVLKFSSLVEKCVPFVSSVNEYRFSFGGAFKL
jgi:hypothetical protein